MHQASAAECTQHLHDITPAGRTCAANHPTSNSGRQTMQMCIHPNSMILHYAMM
jgi:hypothetical protein